MLCLSIIRSSLPRYWACHLSGKPIAQRHTRPAQFNLTFLYFPMRYLVTARVKPGREQALLNAIESRTLGRGSVAGGEYLRNMTEARIREDGSIRWVEVCFCDT